MVAVSLLFTGCGPTVFQKHLYQLRDDTKKQHSATDVRAAVLPLFSADRASTNALPKELTSLPIFSDDPKGIVDSYPLGNTNVLSFVIGSGFGHWGIVVCRSEREQKQPTGDDWFKPRLTPWAEGVYFYSEFR